MYLNITVVLYLLKTLSVQLFLPEPFVLDYIISKTENSASMDKIWNKRFYFMSFHSLTNSVEIWSHMIIVCHFVYNF